MRKVSRFLGSLAMAAVLTVSSFSLVSASSMSVTSGTLSIYTDSSKEEKAKNTYDVYKIASFDVSGGVYTNINVESTYASDFVLDTVKGYTANSSEMDSLAIILYSDAKESDVDPVATNVTGGVVTGLPTGYYLVAETTHSSDDTNIATKYILVAVDEEEEDVVLKTSKPTLEKKIVLEDSSTNVANTAKDTLVDSDVAAIGDDVTYQIKSTIPNYPSDAINVTYVITDTMSTGLTYKANSVSWKLLDSAGREITGLTKDLFTCVNDGQTTTVTMKSSEVKNYGGYTVVVELIGTVNENASVGETGNPNTANLKYTNNWNAEDSYTTTPDDTVITYVGKLVVKKTDSEKATPLGGAVFALYGPKEEKKGTLGDGSEIESTITVEDTTYYYYKTLDETDSTNGETTASGLDAGQYYVVEVAAPAGYNKLTTPQSLALTVTQSTLQLETYGDTLTEVGNEKAANTYKATWTVNSGDSETETIENTKGSTLPGTGGIGTTLFTCGGLVLVVLAAGMFFVYMKKQRNL